MHGWAVTVTRNNRQLTKSGESEMLSEAIRCAVEKLIADPRLREFLP
jgi:hypothetical protein